MQKVNRLHLIRENMSNNQHWFSPFLLLLIAISTFIPVFGYENGSDQDPQNLLWLLDDKYLKEYPQEKEKSLAAQYKQILYELSASKIPTISSAKLSATEYMKRSRCTPKNNDSIKVIKLKKYSYDSPPIAIKGDLVWIVEADIGNGQRLQRETVSLIFLYVNATIGQTFTSSGSSPLPPPKGIGWGIVEAPTPAP